VANAWVDANGGSCTYSATPVAYSDAAACPSFDAAWDKVSSGNTIRVKSGNYGAQNVTGHKTATTKIIAENGTTISGGSPAGSCSWSPGEGWMQADGNYMWLENITINSGNGHGQGTGGCIDASNVTYRNVNLHGAYVSLYVVGPNFTWQGGVHGALGVTGGVRSCASGDGQPIWMESSATVATIDGITFGVKRINLNDSTCGPDHTFHMENVRLQRTNNVAILNNVFVAGSEAGSGQIFITSSSGGATISGLRIEGNIFWPVDGSYAIQIHANVSTYSNWVIRNNRFDQGILAPGTYVNLSACGNTGQVSSSWKASC
jgi:hypothetical protein